MRYNRRMRGMYGILCGSVGIVLGANRAATAQGGGVGVATPSGMPLGSADPSADTGRMVPAHASWATYTTAGQCVVAMQTVQQRDTWQSSAGQLGNGYNPMLPQQASARPDRNGAEVPLLTEGRLPMPPAMTAGAVAAGRMCAQGITVATAPAVTLPDYLMLALLLHDDTLAAAVVHRQRTLVSAPQGHATAQAQATVLARAIAAALALVPPNVELAGVFLRQLDSLPDAWSERFYVRSALQSLASAPTAKTAYVDTLVVLSFQLAPAALTQGYLGLDVLRLYQGYLPPLRTRAATDAAAAALYRRVRAQYLALGTQLRTAGVLSAKQLKLLNDVPPPL